MINIIKSADNLQDGITNMMSAAKEDYAQTMGRNDSVFAFIVKEDFKHFKKGDVLKPASWAAPALNQPRGNVLKGNYPIQWTGPLYL